MTASECVGALRYALWHILCLRGLSWLDRLKMGMLKFVAIAGYNYGKWRTLGVAPSRRPDAEGVQGAHGRLVLGVVVPVYARTQEDLVRLFQALEKLSTQSRQPDFVVLVDDCSPCGIPSMISSERLIVVRLDVNSGPAVARNVGVWTAKRLGVRIVCFMDADCLPQPGWVATMEAAQRSNPGIACGRTMSTEPGTMVGLFHDLCGTLNGRRTPEGTMLYGCTCNLSIDMTKVDHDFDVSFTRAAFEDVEFCVRAVKQGVPVIYESDAVMRHHYDTTIGGLFRQFKRYGMFENHMCFKHKDYLQWLWTSEEISSLSSIGTPLKMRRPAKGATPLNDHGQARPVKDTAPLNGY